MVVLALNQSPDAWELLRGQPLHADLRNIRQSHAAQRTGPVLIFTSAADPDAVATAKTLTALLKADLVRYELHPVSGYTELRIKFDKLARGSSCVEPRSVLCINCGATVDIESVLGLRKPFDTSESDQLEAVNDDMTDDLRIFIMDSHRPFHLKNISSSRVVVFDDETLFDETNVPIDIECEDAWGNVPDDSSSEGEHFDSDDSRSSHESDENSDYGGEIQRNPPPRPSKDAKRPRRSGPLPSNQKRARRQAVTESPHHSDRDSYLDEAEQDDIVFDDAVHSQTNGESDGDEEIVMKTRGHRRYDSSSETETEREPRKSRKRRPRNRRLNDPELEERRRIRKYYSNARLASSSACVSHYVAQRLKRSNVDTVWMAIVGATSQYVLSSVSLDEYQKALSLCRDEIETVNQSSTSDDLNTSSVQNVGYVPTCNGRSTYRIGMTVEIRLDLLRHWSLHDSLLYSSYTAARLSAWRQTGRRRLLELLATVGIPLKESKQQWCYMKQKNKIALDANLNTAIRRFDLGDAFQYDSYVRTIPGHQGDISAADFVYAISALLEFSDTSTIHSREHSSDTLTDRFWRAYDALDPKKTDILQNGLEMATSAQKITAVIGGDVVERRKFVPSGPFRYVFLRDQQFKEFISHPLLLRRLALFLKSALLRQGARDKPFIILAPDQARRKWIAVVATTSGQKNDFGQRFRKAAERNGSEITFDGFDSSVCEIEDGQEIEFVRFLHDVMR